VPPTIVNCSSLPACILNQKKKTIAINTGLLVYTFIKLGDDLTNYDRDILIDIPNST